MQVGRLTVQAMRTSTVIVMDSGHVAKLQARIAELEQTIEDITSRETERLRRRTLLQDATIAAGHPEVVDGPPVPILSLRGWFKNQSQSKPSMARRWFLRRYPTPSKPATVG